MRTASRHIRHRPGRARPVAAAALVVAAATWLSGCAAEEPAPGPTATEPSGSATPGAPSDTARPTEPDPAECPDPGGVDRVEDGFPGRLSTMVGLEVRTGGHPPCFERVVIEFAGSGELPGYRVEYRPDPIVDSPRGEPVDVAGDATLVLSAGAWMPNPEGCGYDGPRELVPTNVETILELEQIENFEGMTAWAIGLDRERDFTVAALEDPTRIVVDITLD
ncbi:MULTISPECIES: AMIN-like domain-containing (lipo)protein [unclassified Agromyces]|uniref:AMIN-like domain-containing (lipo)protein n=1 Tax=unclassified Agromyces TaxID=2639701 RepID=UPI003014EA53